MTRLMTAEDAASLGSVLEENHDTYKEYITDHIRQLSAQVRRIDSFHLFYPSFSSRLLLPSHSTPSPLHLGMSMRRTFLSLCLFLYPWAAM